MKDPGLLLDRLRASMDRFASFHEDLTRRMQDVRTSFTETTDLGAGELRDRLEATGRVHVGALPSPEHQAGQRAIRHEEAPHHLGDARPFAESVLAKIPQAYVDGSQIPVSKDLNIPWAVVNIAGSHAIPGRPLATMEEADIITPSELEAWHDEGVHHEGHVVNHRRWEAELRFLQERMQAHPGTVCVFDGSLINSFATQLPPKLRERYDTTMAEVLDTSAETASPLVGYTDTPRARDLVAMLDALGGTLETHGITDSHLVGPHLQHLGDRTPAWICDRADGSLDLYGGRIIHFHYALLGPGGPCRIEYPSWVQREGRHKEVHDVLLAQCLAYGGYPRSIDECHIKCSVAQDDAKALRRAFTRLAKERGIPVRGARKALAKERGVKYA